ncbi:hypothetical protein DAI22_02g284300 [Oryza sativa Japonica Group]|nr:hypothetical protein DAI22_02g284300 [Oryza sativa Japonica Group]
MRAGAAGAGGAAPTPSARTSDSDSDIVRWREALTAAAGRGGGLPPPPQTCAAALALVGASGSPSHARAARSGSPIDPPIGFDRSLPPFPRAECDLSPPPPTWHGTACGVVRWGWGCGVRWRRAVGSRGCGWMGAFAGAGPWPRRPGGFDRSHWLARVRGSACGGSGLTGGGRGRVGHITHHQS